MRYSFIAAAVLALTASVHAQTAGFDVLSVSPYQDETVTAGSAFTIKWTYTPDARWPASDTVTLTLLQGATPGTLEIGPVIEAGVNNTLGAFTYDIPKDSGSYATYGIKISLDSDPTIFQYSYPFHITSSSSSSASLTGSASTVTVHLSTGSAYVAATTSTSSSANITSTISKSSNSTLITSTYSSAKATGASNATLSVSATPTAGKTTGSGSTASTTSASAIATVSHSAAMANMGKGSLAVLGGMVLAFAL